MSLNLSYKFFKHLDIIFTFFLKGETCFFKKKPTILLKTSLESPRGVAKIQLNIVSVTFIHHTHFYILLY